MGNNPLGYAVGDEGVRTGRTILQLVCFVPDGVTTSSALDVSSLVRLRDGVVLGTLVKGEWHREPDGETRLHLEIEARVDDTTLHTAQLPEVVLDDTVGNELTFPVIRYTYSTNNSVPSKPILMDMKTEEVDDSDLGVMDIKEALDLVPGMPEELKDTLLKGQGTKFRLVATKVQAPRGVRLQLEDGPPIDITSPRCRLVMIENRGKALFVVLLDAEGKPWELDSSKFKAAEVTGDGRVGSLEEGLYGDTRFVEDQDLTRQLRRRQAQNINKLQEILQDIK